MFVDHDAPGDVQRHAGQPALESRCCEEIVQLHRQAEAILLLMSEQGICASAGAACSSGSLEPSHVLKAMGFSPASLEASIEQVSG